MKTGCLWVVGLCAVAFVGVVAVAASTPQSKSTVEAPVQAAEAPAPRVGLVPVGEPVAKKSFSGSFHVDGRVKNTDSQPRTGFLTVTAFDAGGKIVAVASGAVNSVAPDEEATYSAVSTDAPESWATVEARVSTQFRDRD